MVYLAGRDADQRGDMGRLRASDVGVEDRFNLSGHQSGAAVFLAVRVRAVLGLVCGVLQGGRPHDVVGSVVPLVAILVRGLVYRRRRWSMKGLGDQPVHMVVGATVGIDLPVAIRLDLEP